MRLIDPEIEISGYDPYDGLDSYLFSLIKFSKILKIGLIQLNKRSPVNFRKVLGIAKNINPKALALFLLSYYERKKRGIKNFGEDFRELIFKNIMDLQDKKYYGWGYPFHWQSKSFFFPKYLSNTVVSSFVGMSLINYYKDLKMDSLRLDLERLVDFFMNSLNKYEDSSGICLSYSPVDNTRIINTSLLAGEFLIKFYNNIDKDSKIENFINKIFKFSIDKQNFDGSWFYGIDKRYKWIDSFHTGYVLASLNEYYKFSGDLMAKRAIQKGFYYYKKKFFLRDGIVKYYYNKVYPIDIHSISQAIITIRKLENFKEKGEEEILDSIVFWTNKNMYSEKKGYYFFQKNRFYTNKINYLRWAQAWIYYANSFLKS